MEKLCQLTKIDKRKTESIGVFYEVYLLN